MTTKKMSNELENKAIYQLKNLCQASRDRREGEVGVGKTYILAIFLLLMNTYKE